MPRVYSAFPTADQWKKDMELTGVKSLFHSGFSAAEAISELLARLHTMGSRAAKEEKIETIGHIWFHARLVVFATRHGKTTGKAKIGTNLSDSQTDTAGALYSFAESELNRMMTELNGAGDFWHNYLIMFGRNVGAHEAAADTVMKTAGILDLMDAGKLKSTKLSFRNGLAHRKVGGELQLYDTEAFGDVIEVGRASLYVMNERGHVYVHGRKTGGLELKHSSFLQGNQVLAAGTMRWENGKLAFYTPQSGHYKPQLRQMLNVGERLRSYQVDTAAAKFCRVNMSMAAKPAGWPHLTLEPCSLQKFLELRHFPDTRYPNSIFIDAAGKGQ